MLMQMLMVIAIFVNIHDAIELVVCSLFPNHLETWLQIYPNLTCSLLSKHGFELAGMCTFCILGFKIFLTLKPMNYLEMNHEQVMMIIIWSITALEVADLILILFFNGTLCVKQKLIELESIFNLKVEHNTFKLSIPIGAFLGLILLIQEVLFITVNLYQKIRKRRMKRSVTPIKPLDIRQEVKIQVEDLLPDTLEHVNDLNLIKAQSNLEEKQLSTSTIIIRHNNNCNQSSSIRNKGSSSSSIYANNNLNMIDIAQQTSKLKNHMINEIEKASRNNNLPNKRDKKENNVAISAIASDGVVSQNSEKSGGEVATNKPEDQHSSNTTLHSITASLNITLLVVLIMCLLALATFYREDIFH